MRTVHNLYAHTIGAIPLRDSGGIYRARRVSLAIYLAAHPQAGTVLRRAIIGTPIDFGLCAAVHEFCRKTTMAFFRGQRE